MSRMGNILINPIFHHFSRQSNCCFKPDGYVKFTLDSWPVLNVLEDVNWLLTVAVDVDWPPIHLREGLIKREIRHKSASAMYFSITAAVPIIIT